MSAEIEIEQLRQLVLGSSNEQEFITSLIRLNEILRRSERKTVLDAEFVQLLSKRFEESNDVLFRYEISSFFISAAIDIDSSRFLASTQRSQMYSVLVTSLALNNVTFEKTVDLFSESIRQGEKKPYQRIKDLHNAQIVNAIVSRIPELHTTTIRAKVCQLIGKLFARVKTEPYYPPSFTEVLPFVFECFNSNNGELITRAVEALSMFDTDSEEQIGLILDRDPNFPNRLAELLLSHVEDIVYHVVIIVKKMTSGSITQTQRIIDAGVVFNLLWLMDYPNKNVIREVCETISNITQGSTEQIQTVIDAAIIPKLLLLMNSDDEPIQIKATWVVCSLLSNGSESQIDYLINEDVIRAVCTSFEAIYPQETELTQILRLLYSCLTTIINFANNRDEIRREHIRSLMKRDQGNIVEKLEILKDRKLIVREDIVVGFIQH